MNFSKISFKYSLLTISIAIVSFCLILQVSATPRSELQINLPRAQTSIGLPIRLKIPKLNIDTPIEQVGIAPDGSMDVPKKPDDTAWFNLGPRPGEIGSAVIDGHSGWKNNRPAIFDNLSKLKKGDKIYVEDTNKTTVIFVITDFQIYDSKTNAQKVFSSNDGKIHLNLITCTGAWNAVAETHSDRLIVFAEKE
jgi:LPXTG-site transpeptidase (sortase) family protein